jgi:hypothetical protein
LVYHPYSNGLIDLRGVNVILRNHLRVSI